MAPDFRGLVFLAVCGMILLPIVGIYGAYEAVRGIVWLCCHVRLQ